MRVIDQMGRDIEFQHTPSRIISLVPSITELLFDLGFDDEVVGVTKFCVHPKEWHQSKPRIGGTKQLYFDKIAELKPDLIIANKEENTKDLVEQLEKDYLVYVTDINTLEEGYDAIERLGQVLDRVDAAKAMIEETKNQFNAFKKSNGFEKLKGKRYLYFIWLNPDMVVGSQTYIHDVFNELGMINACNGVRYPQSFHNEEVDYIFLSSEPYPFKEKNIPYFQEKYPNAKIVLVDGEIFSWYGSRMRLIISYIENYLLKQI